METRYHPFRHLTSLFLLVSILLAGCGASVRENAADMTPEDAPNTVVVPPDQDVFAPFILMVQPNTKVSWYNSDHVAHTVVSTPERATFLNLDTLSLTMAPGKMASYTFTHPGLYHYYDSLDATWSTNYMRVAPNKGVPKYPMAMEGVIWVQGSLAALPAMAKTYVPNGQDRIFDNFLAIRQGGTVTWHNYDTDAHFFQPVLGWDAPINPVDIGINNLQGTNEDPPNGQDRSITFTSPGLYYYYCFTHASIDPASLRVYAKDNASEYPIPMEGFVLVN